MSNFLNLRPNPNAVKTKWGWQHKNTGEHLVSAAGQFTDVEADGDKKPNLGRPLSIDSIPEAPSASKLTIKAVSGDLSLWEGETGKFSASVNESATQAWLKKNKTNNNFTTLSGQTGNDLTITATSALDGSKYKSSFSFDGETLDTDILSLTVKYVKITNKPEDNFTVTQYDTPETFTVNAELVNAAETDNLTFDWYQKDDDMDDFVLVQSDSNTYSHIFRNSTQVKYVQKVNDGSVQTTQENDGIINISIIPT